MRVFYVLLVTMLVAFSQQIEAKEPFKTVQIEGAHERLIKSKNIDQEYKLLVSLPRHYKSSEKNYPVLYLLDAQWDFTLLVSLIGQLHFDGDIPGVILVGVTWGGENPDAGELRIRDYSPSKVADITNSGGGKQFLAFMKSELIPFVDKEYRTNEDRVLLGSSLGGLFTMYAMFNEPTLFTKYLPTATAAQWDNEVILQMAKGFVQAKLTKPIQLYGAVGENDGVLPGFNKLKDALEKQVIEGLEMKYELIPNVGHSASKSIGYLRGLQHLFAKQEVMLSKAQLERYAGTYEGEGGVKVDIKVDDGRLLVNSPGGSNDYFRAMSENEFFLPGAFVTIRFDHSQKPLKLTAQLFDGDIVLTKTR